MKYLTPEQISKEYEITTTSVYAWLKSGKLKCIRLGNKYRIDPKDFQNFINRK